MSAGFLSVVIQKNGVRVRFMTFNARRFANLASVLALLLAGGVQPVLAQSAPVAATAPAAQPRPWLYENSDVPVDAAWLFGTLPNGLRYAIRRNGVPPGQVSIRVRIDAGSLMEQPTELGFAHFMEHLTFRGSRHVPDGEAKRIWQRLGATFGSDSNANTTATQTVYALDLPQATPDGMDESLKILSGMLEEPNIVPAAVDAERAVVLAEMREGYGPQTRIGDATRKLFFAGQPLASRSPIGTPATLNAATAEMMQAFHDRWYRPERTVIAISGDVDPKVMEALVRKQFSAWSPSGRAAPLPDFGTPDPNASTSAVVVEPGVPSSMSLAFLRPWKPHADTIAYNQGKLIDMLALQLINRRLEAAARAGGSFLQASVDQQDVSRSADGTFVSIIPSNGDWAKALKDVRAIVEDARTTPPSQADIDREYAQLDTALAIQVENEDTEAGSKQAEDMTQAVDIRETTVTPQAALDIFRSAKSRMTPDTLLASTRRMFTGDATRTLLSLQKAEPDAQAKLTAALAAPVLPAKDVRLAAGSVSIDQLPRLGPPGTVVSRQKAGDLGIEIVTFSNGVKLTLFANNAETEKVRVNVRFGHGQKDFSPTRKVANWAGNYALMASGIGNLGQRELDDLTNGRRIGLDFSVDDDAFEMAAVTRPADFRDQLRLLATKLAYPRWDAAPVQRVKAGLLAAYDSMGTSPDAVMSRDLQWLLRDKDVRYRTPDKAEIAALTPEAFRATWEPVLKEGPIEVQVFGDVNADAAIADVAATFGALPPRRDAPVPPVNQQLRFPAHDARPLLLHHSGAPDQAAAVIAWPTSGGFAAKREARQLEILSQIINDRLFEKLRSTDGASYSPNVQNNWPFAYDKGGYLVVISQLKPEKVDYFYSLIGEIEADLAAHPISPDELQRTVGPMRQLLLRASTGNAFWMMQMEGAPWDPRYIDAMETMGADMLGVTPADIQALAKKYLVPGKSWSAVILPKKTTRK